MAYDATFVNKLTIIHFGDCHNQSSDFLQWVVIENKNSEHKAESGECMFHMIEPSLQHRTADDEVSFDMFDHAAVHVVVTTSWVSL